MEHRGRRTPHPHPRLSRHRSRCRQDRTEAAASFHTTRRQALRTPPRLSGRLLKVASSRFQFSSSEERSSNSTPGNVYHTVIW